MPIIKNLVTKLGRSHTTKSHTAALQRQETLYVLIGKGLHQITV